VIHFLLLWHDIAYLCWACCITQPTNYSGVANYRTLLASQTVLPCPLTVLWALCSVCRLFLLGCHYQCKWLTGKTRLWNDLKCVDVDVKPYSLTHSLTQWNDLCAVVVTCWCRTGDKVWRAGVGVWQSVMCRCRSGDRVWWVGLGLVTKCDVLV